MGGRRCEKLRAPGEEDRVASNTSVLAGLEPRSFWEHFESLTRISRPSRAEGPVIEHVRAWASERGLALREDTARNLVVDVPATPGRENASTLVLQGHLDMVCERDPDSANDPAEGRIELALDGDWLTANGTTLGADDGVAIAAMMALAEDESLPHGPLELLMTVAEEVGLAGANALDGSLISGSTLINLDSEEDGVLTVGCAGSTDTWIRLDAPRAKPEASTKPLTVTVSGGQGGHSGTGIALGRSNAVKVLGRALRGTYASVPFRLVSLAGGKSRNAIPRESAAVVSVESAKEADFTAAIEHGAATIREAFSKTDPGLSIAVGAAEKESDPWTEEATGKMLDVIALVPTGPLAMSPDFEGLVETSNSLGEAITEGDQLILHSLTRSSNDAAMPDVLATLDAAAQLGDGSLEVRHNYNGWRPDLDSAVLAAARRVYEQQFGTPPVVTAVHAGLETSVIGSKVDRRLDMLAIGPQIEFPHSPDERVSIPTVERFWQLLVAVVDEYSKAT
jgi:dipeptidase D